MMKFKFLRIALTAVLAVSLYSCREEMVQQDSAENKVVIADATVKNGRLYFPNKESLTYAYDKIKDAEDEAIADYVDRKDIISLRPIVTEKNEAVIGEKLEKRIALLKANKRYMSSKGALNKIENVITDDIDDLEEIIGDDAYAAFLDSRAEIQVANQIYKYTDVGLFIVEDSKYNQLSQYLAVNEISDDLMYSTEDLVKQAYVESKPSEQVISVEDGIKYFNAKIAPMDPDGGSGGGSGGSGGSGGTGNPPVNPTDPMYNYINNLQNCAPTNGLFDGLFGDSDICKDQYESRYRVKTKAYNYNYYLAYNLGVKVKHQYKGWTGIWRKESAQEIRLGVIASQFSYDYSQNFQYPTTKWAITTIYNNNNRLMFDANVNWSQNGLNIIGYSTQGFPKILQDDIVIEQFSNNQYINQAIQSGNKQLTADKLNQQFWNYVIPTLGNWWQNLDKPVPNNNITYLYKAPNYGKILIQKTMYKNAYNDDKLEKSFDWGFQVGFKLNPDNGNISPDTSGSALKKPQEFRILMYGIAKRNGQWHGSKINTINS